LRLLRSSSLRNEIFVLTAADVSCLVIPDGCMGLPRLAALEQGIPVIAVKENRKRMRNELGKLPFGPGKLFIVRKLS
jgi:hypothetical protein